MKKHGVQSCSQPSRSAYKIGSVERNNGIMKGIIVNLDKNGNGGSASISFSRSSLIINCLIGSKLMSSFQLLKGYNPSILGIPSSTGTYYILQVHIKIEEAREMERAIRLRI